MKKTLLTMLALLSCWLPAAAKEKPHRVVATVMTTKTGGPKLANGKSNDANERVFVALPDRSALGRKVTVTSPETGKTVSNCLVDDVGPHSVSDPYWKNDTRPISEKGLSDKYASATNKAGIDLSLMLCRQLGLKYPYKGEVVWWFEKTEI